MAQHLHSEMRKWWICFELKWLTICVGKLSLGLGVIMIVCNNKMEKRTMQRKGEENSHGILQLICASQDSDTFIRDLQSHKITEKCRVLEQRMHQNYKSTPSRHVSTIGKRASKGPKHLVKHDNKI